MAGALHHKVIKSLFIAKGKDVKRRGQARYSFSFPRVFLSIGSTHRLAKKRNTNSMHSTIIHRVEMFDTIRHTIAVPITIISSIYITINSVERFMLQDYFIIKLNNPKG